jgi:hypothetical protein
MAAKPGSESVDSALRTQRSILADRRLVRMTAVSGNTISGDLQTPKYTGAILAAYALAGVDLSPAIDPDAERTAQQSRGATLRANKTAEKIYIMPRNALRMQVGSWAVTAENVAHIRDELNRVRIENNPTIIAFYDSHDDTETFDPIIAHTKDSYKITEIKAGPTEEIDRRVWVADSTVLAARGDFPDIRYPEIARLLLERPDTVTGAAAMAEANNALDYLNSRMLNG